MEKAYQISDITFENEFIIFKVNDQLVRLKLADISSKLASATNAERYDYKISPSGYGIHWRLLDEDLSINGLLSKFKNQTTI